MFWTEAQDARIATMLVAGKSARDIANAFGAGITRNAVIGRVNRNKDLKAIGFTRTGEGSATSRPRKTSIKASNVFRGEKPPMHQDNVVTLHVLRQRKAPGSMLPIPVKSVKAPLRIVSNNEKLMIADYLQKTGARRYEMGFCSDYHGIQGYLAMRGVDLTTRNNGKFTYIIRLKDGQSRKATWQEVLQFADEFRRSEGLEPILAGRVSA